MVTGRGVNESNHFVLMGSHYEFVVLVPKHFVELVLGFARAVLHTAYDFALC